MRSGLPAVAALLALSIAAGLWAVGPFRDLPEAVPQEGGAAAGAGTAIAVVGVLLLAAAAAALVWAVRKDLDRAVRLVVRAAIAFGLLLLLVRPVLGAPSALPALLAWGLAAAAAIALASVLREGWPAQVAAALAAGGFAGMAAAAAAADAMAAPLTVGSTEGGFSLGLGDLLLPAALVAAAAGHGLLVASGAAVGTAAGLLALSAAVRRADVPGIPYLAGGALAGVALALGAMALRPFVS